MRCVRSKYHKPNHNTTTFHCVNETTTVSLPLLENVAVEASRLSNIWPQSCRALTQWTLNDPAGDALRRTVYWLLKTSNRYGNHLTHLNPFRMINLVLGPLVYVVTCRLVGSCPGLQMVLGSLLASLKQRQEVH